ncbi:hypothetical protein PR202_gb29804 [Eleusine coracana subsp. coracana]|uniref:VWFA domain-containing protein n=1 Tax=Eleusine coracana subsp. coracana TaxID=191504 RepID=A0AAV5G131_ELECO|nr:hypothetical protein PR202_gb29804 [Eleusine coracana subsp. coracana]
MRTGHGQALFTAECSHKFHFHCISSNVQHGNHVCPICRAVWKELPFQGAQLPDGAANVHGPGRVNPSNWPQGSRLSRINTLNQQDHVPPFRTPESVIFNDDEEINIQSETTTVRGGGDRVEGPAVVEMMTYAELPAIVESVTEENFAILIHLKAPSSPASLSSRAPLDLVTVLDVSGSMAGSKLALLKRAMSFVIDCLGPNDRLSVIAFSTSAWRLFPLRKMTAFGKQQSHQAVSSLVANGGTNIAEALWKASRVMEDRQARNPVSGGYASGVSDDGREGFVEVGDLYADEERDFLVTVRVPPGRGDTALVLAAVTYRDAVTADSVRVQRAPVIVVRTAVRVATTVAPEVEREWHRVRATEDMAAARAAAEGNDFARAAEILEARRRALESCARLRADPQTVALVAELREMQDRAENRPRYEESGRAYILAGLSSHSWQRATARGDSTELTGLVHTYQTPSMVDMLHRSHALLPEVVDALNRSPTVAPSRTPAVDPGSPLTRRGLRMFRPTKSFTGRTS